jgi:hypothetical protein
METAATIIEKAGDARSATKALKVLNQQVDQIQEAAKERRSRSAEPEDFTYTYQEEADPEVFFAPYVWEIIVCCVTSSSIEWYKDKIRVFPLLNDDEPPPHNGGDNGTFHYQESDPRDYSKDVVDVV